MTNPGAAVLLVGNHLSRFGFNPGPSEALAKRLAGRGWRVLAASTRPSRVVRLCDMLGAVWRLRDRYEVAHVEVFSGKAFVWAEAVCRLLRGIGKPYAITLHGGGLPDFAKRWPRRVAWMLASAGAVTAPSPYLTDHARPWRKEVRLIPNGIDVRAFHYRRRRRACPRLVWVRAFHDIYAPELAVETLSRLRLKFPDEHLTMIVPDKGDGSFQRTRRLARRLGLSREVVFPGAIPRDELPARLEAADIFLNTSRVDNAPFSVTEAMAAGLCVVSTPAGGLPQMLADGKNALLAPGDPESLAAAVARVLREPDLAENLSAGARASVEPNDWSRVLPQWERLFLQLREHPR
jgi:glycosyltransferase involved in cell wall biosynthesis